MGHAILELMQDAERRAVLGRAAREKAVREYNLHQFGRTYFASYTKLARVGSGGHRVPLAADAVAELAAV
jgi:hypothetical protein